MNTVNYGHYPIAGDRLWDRFRKKHWNAVDLFLQKGLTCDECGKEIIPQWWALRLATASSMLGSMIAQIISAWLIRTLGCNIWRVGSNCSPYRSRTRCCPVLVCNSSANCECPP